MTKVEALMKLSHEGREWAKLFMPIIVSFVTGLHLPQPKYLKGKADQ